MTSLAPKVDLAPILAAIAALDAKIDTIDTEVGNLQGDVTSIETKVDTVDTVVDLIRSADVPAITDKTDLILNLPQLLDATIDNNVISRTDNTLATVLTYNGSGFCWANATFPFAIASQGIQAEVWLDGTLVGSAFWYNTTDFSNQILASYPMRFASSFVIKIRGDGTNPLYVYYQLLKIT